MISKIVLLLEIITLRILTIVGVDNRPQVLIIPMISLFFITYVFDTSFDEIVRPIQIPLVLGLVFRIALLLFDIYGRRIYILPNSGADADMFYNLGVSTSMGFENQRGFFIDLLGFIFKYIGVTRLYVQFLLMLCSIVSLHVVNRILVECNVEEEIRYRTMLILCLLPNFAILSSIMLRESIITMLISISLYYFIKWVNLRSEVYFVMALIPAFIGMIFHSGVIAVPIAFLIIRVIYVKEKGTFAISFGNVIITFVLLVIIVFLLNRYGDNLLGKFRNVDSIEDIAAIGRTSGSSYAQYVGNSNSIFNMFIYTIPRLIFFLFSPMPFQWRGISDIIAFMFDSVFYIIVVLKVQSYLRYKNNRNVTIVILLSIIAFTTMFVFAWGTSNTGTAVRHRGKAVALYGLLLSLTWKNSTMENKCEGDGYKYIK